MQPPDDCPSLTCQRSDYARLATLHEAIGALHAVGWGLFAHYTATARSLAYSGAGAVAYRLGLRHAFDADHITAIDDATRLLVRRGRLPLGVGFFFSLGHATVVLVLSVAVAFAAHLFEQHLEPLRQVGGVLGALISGGFLYLVGTLNLVTLREMLRARSAGGTEEGFQATPEGGGLLGRVLSRGLRRWIKHDWQMWPIGLLFGLGFDTASEIGLLGLTASTSANGGLPVGAILTLPRLFAAGMCLLDTTDGVLMTRAYAWDVERPQQRLSYNLLTTGLSVVVAFGVGTLELGGVLSQQLGLRGALPNLLDQVNTRFEALGSVIVAVFMVIWAGAVIASSRRELHDGVPRL